MHVVPLSHFLLCLLLWVLILCNQASVADTENLHKDGGWPRLLPISNLVFRSDALTWPPCNHVYSLVLVQLPGDSYSIFYWHFLLHFLLCPQDSLCGPFYLFIAFFIWHIISSRGSPTQSSVTSFLGKRLSILGWAGFWFQRGGVRLRALTFCRRAEHPAD